MVDLRTRYLDRELKNPFVAAASPLSEKVSTIRRLEDAGAAAIVMHSLFEEQIAREEGAIQEYLDQGTESFAESLSYFPALNDFPLGPEEYLNNLRKAKEAVSIPVIASLNGITAGGWIDYARNLEAAGADAIECNVYYVPTNPDDSSEDVELRYIDILKTVKGAVSIPVAMKLSPYFSSIAGMAKRLCEGGADALVLFNRFYQPDIDLEALEIRPNLVLSTPFESRLALRWIAILYGRLDCKLAATSGIHTGQDAIKLVMAGADVVQVCSVLLRKGIDHLETIRDEMSLWMESKEYESVDQMKGSMSQKSCPDPTAFERANYMKTLMSYPRSGSA